MEWRVDSIDGEPVDKQEFLALRIRADGSFFQSVPICTGYDGQLRTGPDELVVESARPSYANCIAIPGQQQRQHELMHAMGWLFAGHVAWSLDGDRLTLHKDGGPTVVYTRKALAPPQGSFTVGVVLDRTTAPARGEPLSGSLVVQNETGKPIEISNACNGWW